MELNYQYTKKRVEFGRQPLFCEQGPDMCDSIPTNKIEQKLFILRNPVHQAIQNTPLYSHHEINTIRAELTTGGANHSEGGWPKDVNIHDPEATQRYRRKIEKEDNYIHCVMNQFANLEKTILENNAIDIYQTYYTEMEKQPPPEHSSCRTVNVYRDKHQRPVTGLSWKPEFYKFSVLHTDVDYYNQARGATETNLWDLDNFNEPEGHLDPKCAMFDLRYNPQDCNMLLGGLSTGQVCAFDPRTGPNITIRCPPHVAHRELVRKVRFMQSKTNMDCISGGPDGCCKWWDLRNLDEPTDEMIIDVVQSNDVQQSMATSFGISALEYEPTMPSRFMVGTENGLIIGGNRKGKTPLEKLPQKFDAHLGPVWSLERNPTYLKNFLTVGDWRLRIWSEECRESPILWSPLVHVRQRYMCGGWSPTRMSLVLLCTEDGKLSLWDILRNQYEAVFTMQLDKTSLISHRFHEKGGLVVLGSRAGNTYLVQLADCLRHPKKNDKAMITAVFDRESRRERVLESRLREIRLKMKQTDEETPIAPSQMEVDPTIGDHDLFEATADYNSVVKKELAAL